MSRTTLARRLADLAEESGVFDRASDATAGRWQDRALCAQVDNEIFFPEKGGSTRAAKEVCMRCDVRQQCLDWALDHGERFGIWGGKSGRERHKLEREHRGRPRLAAREPVQLREPIITAQCGTKAGVKAHWRRDERPCDHCAAVREETFANLRAARPRTGVATQERARRTRTGTSEGTK